MMCRYALAFMATALMVSAYGTAPAQQLDLGTEGFSLEDYLDTVRFSIYIGNNRSGDAIISSEIKHHRGRKAFSQTMQLDLTMDAHGDRKRFNITQSVVFYVTGELVSSEVSMGELGSYSGVVEGNSMRLITVSGGRHSERMIPAPDIRLQDVMAELLIVFSKPSIGDSIRSKTFDPTTGRVMYGETRVTGSKRFPHQGVEAEGYQLTITFPREGLSTSSTITTAGELVEMTMPVEHLTLVLKRESPLRKTSAPVVETVEVSTPVITAPASVDRRRPTDEQIRQAIERAKSMLGRTYRRQEVYPHGYYYSCLAFVQDAYTRTTAGAGMTLGPWGSAANAARLMRQELNTTTEPPPGAWVFYEWHPDGHVSIAVGDGDVIHSYTSDAIAGIRKDRYDAVGVLHYIGWTWPRGPYALPDVPEVLSPGHSEAPISIVDTLTPRLRWNPVDSADLYAIAITKEPYGSANIVYKREDVTGTSHIVPDGKLERATSYRWNMQARIGGRWSNVSATLYFQTPGAERQPHDETEAVEALPSLDEINAAIDFRLEYLPAPPISLQGESSRIRDKIAYVVIHVPTIFGSKRLDKYDEWYFTTLDYHGLIQISLHRARAFAQKGDLATAQRYIDESDRYCRVFHHAGATATATYLGIIAKSEMHAQYVYESSRIAFMVLSAGVTAGPLVAIAADNLYTAIDFAITWSDEGLSRATRRLIIDLVAKDIAKLMGIGVEAIGDKLMSDFLREIARDSVKLSEFTKQLARDTGEKLTEKQVSNWINRAADAMEER